MGTAPRMRREDGFTLVEMVVVTAIVAIVIGTLGTFFLAGTTPAVASAGRDVSAAFDEARRAAIAFDAATVVFAPAVSGSGYRARVYARFPGDPAFAPRNGPAYESTVAITETAAPLGALGFAFSVDVHGAVTGFAHFVAGQPNAATTPCPATGAFALRLAYASDVRVVLVPCRLTPNAGAPVVFETPPAAATPLALPSPTCPATETCSLALVPPAPAASCPPGYTPDASLAGVCDVAAAPPPAPTCPPGYTGTPPDCAIAGNPTAPPATATPGCAPGAADALGFATCLESDPIRISGNAITRSGCGTHTPIADPGASFGVVVELWQNGVPWGSYAVELGGSKTPWLDFVDRPPSQTCGLLYTLTFHVTAIGPQSGNAATNPLQDTGDPALANAGVDAILFAPSGGAWGSNS